jgi:aspartate-semialdehyde dehydrogenase
MTMAKSVGSKSGSLCFRRLPICALPPIQSSLLKQNQPPPSKTKCLWVEYPARIKMNKHKRMKVAIVGATGMVGRKFAELLIDHPWYEVAMLVGFRSAGVGLGSVWDEKEAKLYTHYGQDFWTKSRCPDELRDRQVHSFDALLEDRTIDIIFSAIPPSAWHLERQLLQMGRTVFSNSPYGRFDEENPLVVAEVNGEELVGQQFIKNPNCVTSGLALILAPIRACYGLEAVSIVTFQSLTGKGDAKYPRDLVVGNVYPLHESDENVEEYITKEIRKIFKEMIPISVSCHRVYVQEGHFVDVKIKTNCRSKSEDDVAELFRTFNPLGPLSLPSSPESPLLVISEPGRPRPRQDSLHSKGMAVAVGGISIKDDFFDLRLRYVVNNLARGAAGGAILNSELFMQKRKLPQL